MNNYIVIYYATSEAVEATANMAPEEKQAGMKAWENWSKRCGDGLIDFGSPLHLGLKVTSSGTSDVDNDVMFYSILRAENRDAAEQMLKDHPHLDWAPGCDLEVYECMPTG